MLGLAQNIHNHAITQVNYPFNSIASVNNKFFGCTSAGIYEIDAGMDFAGVAFTSYFETEVNMQTQMRLRSMVLGVETAGNLSIDVTIDDRTTQSFTFVPDQSSNKQHRCQLYLSPSFDKGSWVKIKVSGVVDFSIDEISLLIIPLGLNRRHGNGT